MNKWDTNNLDKKNKPRLKYKSRASLDHKLKEVFDRIVDSKRGIGVMSNGSLPGPFNGWMYTDYEFARALDLIGIAVREHTSNVPEIMKQIAICCIAVHYKTNVEYWAHSQLAKKHGVKNETLEAILGEQYPKFKGNAHEKEQEVSYRFTQEFLQSYQVSDNLYNETLNVIGSEKGMVEFICVI